MSLLMMIMRNRRQAYQPATKGCILTPSPNHLRPFGISSLSTRSRDLHEVFLARMPNLWKLPVCLQGPKRCLMTFIYWLKRRMEDKRLDNSVYLSTILTFT